MTNENKHAGWTVWILWTLVNTISYILLRSGLIPKLMDIYFEAITGVSVHTDIGLNPLLLVGSLPQATEATTNLP